MGYVAWNGQTYEGTPPEGWHEASDGRWWPIGEGPTGTEQTEPMAPPPVRPPPPAGRAGPSATPSAVAPPPTAPQKRSGCLMAALIIGVIAAIVVVVGLIVAVFLADSDGDEAAQIQPIESASDEEASPGSNDPITSTEDPEASGAADEIDGVRSCSWVGDEVKIELVNNSSKTSDYIITTAYLDEAGDRVGACELGPPDFADDATATLVVTNSSSKISDYTIEVAL